MNDHQDFFDEITTDDPPDRRLAASLRSWRDSARIAVEPDARLDAMFSSEQPAKQPARWRQWMQRPAIAFAASFAAVLLLGAGAFALVANADNETEVAAPTTSALSVADGTSVALGDISLPEDLSDQTGYATCIFDQLTAWFAAGLGSAEAPRIADECGMPPIPDLGPEAEAFRTDLQAWANCAVGEVQSLLPDLPSLLKDGQDGDRGDPLEACGEPPDPRDYGLELPFLDFSDIDPSQFDFGPFNLEEFKSKFKDFDSQSFNLQELLSKLPPGLLPDDVDLENLSFEELKALFGDFEFKEFDLESCVGAEGLPDAADLDQFDFESFFAGFEGCGFGFLGGGELGDLDLSEFFSQFEDFTIEGLQDLDLESLLSGFNFDDFEGLDLDKLLADLFGDEELDLSALFKEFSEQGSY